MSNFEPNENMRKRANDNCNAIWKYTDELSKHIDTLQEGQTKEYLKQYNQTLGFIAELYFFNAVTFGQIQNHEEWLKMLHHKVLGNESVTMPYKPTEDEGLVHAAKKYKEKEPILEWWEKTFANKAKDVEKNE